MIALTFSGQGSHYENMGRQLYQTEPAARQVYDLARQVFGFDVLKLSLDQLGQTDFAQPAIVTFSLALWQSWAKARQPDQLAGLAGFSLGEYSSLAAAGVLDLLDLFWLVQARAKYMAKAARASQGQMLAVLGLADEVICAILCEKPWQDKVFPANFNAPGQLVVSGLAEFMPALTDKLIQAGARRVVPLQVSAAFHTPFMAEAAHSLKEAASSLSFRQPQASLYSNINAQPLPVDLDWPDYLARQLCSPVLWHETIRNMQAAGADTFLEFGPGRVLTGLARKICPDTQAKSLDTSKT